MKRSENPKHPPHGSAWMGALFVVVALATAGWLYGGAPQLGRTPGWFYQWVDKGSFDMLLVAAASAFVPVLVRASFGWARSRFWAAAGCVVLGSILVQIAAGVVARQGVRAWTERFHVGHGEFTVRAKFERHGLRVLRDYERQAAERQLGLYGPSKPPGTYAVYLMLDRTAHWSLTKAVLAPVSALVARDPSIFPEDRTLIAWTVVALGLCAALTALPLCWLGRMLFADTAADERAIVYPAWLFVSVPAINVITVHLDSSVFPLLSASSTALCAASVRAPSTARRGLLAASGGALAMLAVYCSYGNLPIFGVATAVALGLALQLRGTSRAALVPIAATLSGALAVLLVLRLALNWQPIAGYLRGVAYHAKWRPGLPSTWRYGLAFLEFSLFAGPPLMLAFCGSTFAAVRGKHFAWGVRALTLAAAAVMLVISLWLGTPEAARLWLFMLPWICCAVAASFARGVFRGAFCALLACQLALVLFVKNYMVW